MLRASDDGARPAGSSPPAEPAADRAGLAGLRTAEIRAELARREQQLPRLLDRQERLLHELRRVEQEVASLQGRHRLRLVEDDTLVVAPAPRPPSAPKPKTRTRLGDAITAVVDLHAFVIPKEALYLLKESGYPMTRSLLTRVTATLAGDERFSRIERGKYERVR